MTMYFSKHAKFSLVPILLFLLSIWLITFLQKGMGWEWSRYGIEPRTLKGLTGIIVSPLLHQGWSHLLANTIPLFILGWFVYYFYKEIANKVIAIIWLTSGILTWIIGRPVIHIGASGIIFGLTFFLFFSGVWRKNLRLMSIALITVFLYGSTLWSIFPVAEIIDPQLSWEGHLSGAFAGLLAAFLLRKEGPQKEPEPWDNDDVEDDVEVSNNFESDEENRECTESDKIK